MIYINLRGGLGNQLFQYASARSFAIAANEKLCLDLSGITNKTHNIYALDKFNINAETVNECHIWQKKVSRVFLSISYRIGKRFGYDKSYKFDVILSYILNLFGIYNIDNGYMKFKRSITKNKYINGYLQSDKYFEADNRIIREELSLKEGLSENALKLSNTMKSQNSVCVHIRRGDFVNIGGIVCTHEYYEGAVKYLAQRLENPEFYIFSNDIPWVRENISFPVEVNFIDDNNPNYEEIILMSSCNNFVISNSTFSWWGQFLSENKGKIVIAPDRWFVDGQREDIYQDDWIIMNSAGKVNPSV